MSQSSLAKTPDNYTREEARRSTRIERSVPLIIFGQDRLGEPFVERTVSTSVNLHGCRYPSRHDYGVGTWITLQVVGLSVEPKPAAVRARVRSVHVSQSSRELQQVGVELEYPSNVWGVVTPPPDWLSFGPPCSSVAEISTAPANPLEASPLAIGSEEPPFPVEHKLAEVATFPSPSPATSKPAAPKLTEAPKLAEAPKPQRVVITPDGLIKALQGRLQQAAESAVQAAIERQLADAVRAAVASIDDVRQTSVREVQELFPTRVEATTLSSREQISEEIAAQWKQQMDTYRGQVEEMAERLERQTAELRRELAKSQEILEKMNRETEPQVQARLDAAVTRASSDFEGAASRAMERRYERLLENTQAVTQEALLRLEVRSAEVQALLQGAVNSALAAFQRQTEMHALGLLSETKERATAALTSLDAESRASCDARRQALETEVARATERSTDQFRKSMKAFLYSCLVAAVSAVDEHSKSTLEGILQDNRKSSDGENGSTEGPEILPAPDKDPFTH